MLTSYLTLVVPELVGDRNKACRLAETRPGGTLKSSPLYPECPEVGPRCDDLILVDEAEPALFVGSG